MRKNETAQSGVAIVIAAYNPGSYLKEAIDSCLQQTYKNCRLIIINDASSDGTAKLLTGHGNTPAVTVITNNANKGRAKSLNQVLLNLEEPYVALLDADDVMYPDRIKKQVAFMEANPEVGASSGFMDYISSKGIVIGHAKSDLLSEKDAQRYVENKDPFAIFTPCSIIRTEIFKSDNIFFRPEFWPADDVDLWNRIHEGGWHVLVQPEFLTQYRIHANSAVTSNFFYTRMQFEFLRECMRARRRGNKEPTKKEFIRMMKSRPLWVRMNSLRKTYAKGVYRAGGFAFAEKKYLRAIRMLTLAGVLQPIYVFRRLKQQVRLK